MSLTAEQLSQRIEELSKFTLEDLEGMTVKALRQKLSGCGVTGVERDGKQVQVASCKKVELIEAVQKVTFKEKVVSQMVPDLTVTDLERLETLGRELGDEQNTDYSEIAFYFYKELRTYVEKRWDSKKQCWEPNNGALGVLANQLVEKLRSLYRDKVKVDKEDVETLESHHYIRLNARTAILKRIEKFIVTTDANQHYYEEFLRTFGTKETEVNKLPTFKRFCFLAMGNDAQAKKVADVVKLKVRKTNRSVLNLTRMLEKAYQVLSTLDNASPKTMWSDVALSLVLVTGRRPYSEVLCSAEFEVVGDYELKFTGQAKTKGKSERHYQTEPSYNIPTLVKAELAVKALEWLKVKGKRINILDFPGDIQRARDVSDTRYSKDLSAHMKKWVFDYLDLTVASENPKKVTPHTLRGFYSLAACREFGGTNNYDVDYAARILGHDMGDDTTAQRYQQDFLLSADSVCKL